jgi:hypothetical protein
LGGEYHHDKLAQKQNDISWFYLYHKKVVTTQVSCHKGTKTPRLFKFIVQLFSSNAFFCFR